MRSHSVSVDSDAILERFLYLDINYEIYNSFLTINTCNYTFIVKEITLIHIMSLAWILPDGGGGGGGSENSNIRQCHRFRQGFNLMMR